MKTFSICQDIIFQLSRLSQHLSSCFLNYKNILKPSSLILCLLFSFDILILYLAFCEDEWILILLVEAKEMKLIYYIFSGFFSIFLVWLLPWLVSRSCMCSIPRLGRDILTISCMWCISNRTCPLTTIVYSFIVFTTLLDVCYDPE